MFFVDTNVFFYAQDNRYPQKQAHAHAWLETIAGKGLGRANLQVANEFAHVVFRRMPELGDETVFSMCDEILGWGQEGINHATVAGARELKHLYRFSWWDCLLLASALELRCTHFLSEDLQDMQTVEGLTIVDPFAHSPGEILPN